jgi:hypothetical protein
MIRRALSSPRRRRRLAWLSGVAAVVTGFVLVGIWTMDRGNVASTVPGTPQRVKPLPRTVRRSPAAIDDVRKVAERFIETAVYRRHLDVAWDLSAPVMHQGMTRKEWRTGDIPVTPFPANQVEMVKWKLDYSYPNVVALKVALLSKPHSSLTGLVGDLELQAVGRGQARHWLVDAWIPMGGGQALQRAISPLTSAATTKPAPHRLGGAWIFAPVGAIFFLILLIPVWLGVRGWHRQRSAMRAYTSSSRPS